MFNTEEIIGDIIYISFKDQNRYSDFGVVGIGHFLIKGYDNIGIWVEHPNLILSTLTDEKGKPLNGNFINLPYYNKKERPALNLDGTYFTFETSKPTFSAPSFSIAISVSNITGIIPSF